MTRTTSLRRYLWTLLSVGTSASVAANVAHAQPGIGPRIMSVAAPIALLAFTHLVGLWGRVRTSGPTYWAILVTVALIAIGAARVSFASVQELALSYGYGDLDASLLPLLLDGGLAVTALALVVLSRIEAEGDQNDQPVITSPDAPINAVHTVDLPLIDAVHGGDQPRLEDSIGNEPVRADGAGTDDSNDRADPHREREQIAELIAATGRTTQPPSVITAVLAARAEGRGQKSAGAVAGVAQGTVRTIERLRDEVSGRPGRPRTTTDSPAER
jgi:hypothetical protein